MKKIIFLFSLLFLPAIASAAFVQTRSLIVSVGQIVQSLTVLVMGLALLFFFWGLAKFIFSAGNEEKLAEGKSIMVWGVIALFFMSSIWGIVAVVGRELGIRSGGIFDVGAPPSGSTPPSGGPVCVGGDDPSNPRYDCGCPGQGPCL